MRHIIVITVSFFWINFISAQNLSSESSIVADSITTQRVAVSNEFFGLKYDYKVGSPDVFSLAVPKIYSDSSLSVGAMLLKVGDEAKKDLYAIDLFGKLKINKLSISLEMGRMLRRDSIPNDFLGGRLSYGSFTAEAYIVNKHPVNHKFNKDDQLYAWLAYHPEKLFVSAGIADKQYWLFGGTKNLDNFGNLLLSNYDPESGNFWFRNQTGFGKIDQGFFNQDLYIFATNYLVVPAFHFQRFSPIATKGSYSLKIDGRRTNGLHNYELIMGREIGQNLFRVALGLNSEYQKDLRLAPSLELYKDFKIDSGKAIIEMRYDFLYKSFSTYFIFRY